MRKKAGYGKFIPVIILVLSLVSNCKKFEPVPLLLVRTDSLSGVIYSWCEVSGTIVHLGEDRVAQHGFCWSESGNPTTETGSKNELGPVEIAGDYTGRIVGLKFNTQYYLRAYATDEAGTTYGNEISFTTAFPSVPSLSTKDITEITDNSAHSGGTITDDGGDSVIIRGVCWSTSQNPTLSDSFTTDGAGTGTFTSNLTGLVCNTTYYVRAYASNASGTAYGSQVSFVTTQCSADLPTVTTSAITGKTETSAQGGGAVTDDGGAAVTERGVCWSTSQNPTLSDSFTTDGAGTGTFTSNLTGLVCNTTYYVRAYASNASGTAYGAQVSFTTDPCPISSPTVTTTPVTSVTDTTARSGGEVTDDGGAAVTVRGVCWNTSQNPTLSDSFTTDGAGTGSFTSDLTGLSPNTTYYVRAYATNSEGTGYGNETSFLTSTEQVVDYDGNVYRTVVIGTQTWMAENLRVTHYPDGSPIPLVENNSIWDGLTPTGEAYCWNDNNAATGNTYGALYTWAAAMNGSAGSETNPSGVQGVCPSGWHLPSDGEWKELEMHLGMTQASADNTGWRGNNEGGKLKEAGTDHWNSPNTGANNASGFTALPGGNRHDYGTFQNVGNSALFWTATEFDGTNSWGRSLGYSIEKVYRGNYARSNGFSVRCIRDE